MNLVNELVDSLSDNSFLKLMRRYAAFDLIIIDELGYLPVDKQGADLLFQIISNLYETGSVVVTTNRPFADWGKVFNNDATLAGGRYSVPTPPYRQSWTGFWNMCICLKSAEKVIG